MTILQICQWLSDSPLGTSIRESEFSFDLIETTHVLGITLMAGTVALFDLRLLGLVFTKDEVSDVAGQVLPLTVAGFVLMALSGILLLWSEAAKMYFNPAFRVKLILMLAAGLNPLIFHKTVYRNVAGWELAASPPTRAKIAGILSLALWTGIIVSGRAIAYFH